MVSVSVCICKQPSDEIKVLSVMLKKFRKQKKHDSESLFNMTCPIQDIGTLSNGSGITNEV